MLTQHFLVICVLCNLMTAEGRCANGWLFFFLLCEGSSKRQVLTVAARTLAGEFQDRLKTSAESLMENVMVM